MNKLLTLLLITAMLFGEGCKQGKNEGGKKGPAEFAGEYTGKAMGLTIKLNLQKKDQGKYEGTMISGDENYVVEANSFGDSITGIANEKQQGLVFTLSGHMPADTLYMQMVLDDINNGIKVSVPFVKSSKENNASGDEKQASKDEEPAAEEPSGLKTTRDGSLVGKWTSSQSYTSGTFSAAVQDEIYFNADGKFIQGGGAMAGGDQNVSGVSKDGSQTDAGLSWYTEGNQLYLQGHENGKLETYHVGRFYIERGKLLVTRPDGGKKIWYKAGN